MTKKNLITVTHRHMPRDLWRRAKRVAFDREVPVGVIVTEALGSYLKGRK